MNKKVKKVLGQERIEKLKAIRQEFYLTFVKFIASNKIFRMLYVIFSSSFDNEIDAVFQGQVRYTRNRQSADSVNYLLRRNIHRIEKGLIMKPRRNVFAVNYIFETVCALQKSIESKDYKDEVEIHWAIDILNLYFTVIDLKNSEVSRSKKLFDGLNFDNSEESNAKFIPYKASLIDNLKVPSFDVFSELVKARRSIRFYSQKKVPKELIDKAISMSVQSPSACNRFPIRFKAVYEDDSVKTAASLPMGIAGFGKNIPVLIAVVGQLRAYPKSRDRHVIYVDGGLASMTFMYAAQTLGLNTLPINWPDIADREKRAANFLNLDKDERIIMWIGVGYCDKERLIPASAKIDVEIARDYL
ncbi:nitroreductase family protein [Zooshikella ganghwensis]|uniref:Nitroreductase n=1 Tax=Zooshikella ganghwensis TaxID=202772 RepID=A0A4P9VLE2_9GAMM|nr:nitroreductase family protein [Zooshikella ganghwensis]RDH43157.1 nitroreductase [Zooshikella ganghwensis]